ncbi:hypothetical protein [Clostridium sp.]|uniref:hypothetical protein n=1 Tax=Clostridium sp. TaxID=1506 RepID=UPI003464DF28
MDLNDVIEMKNQNPGATGFYNNREIFIRKVHDNSGLVEVVDLFSGEVYALHSSKIDKTYANSSNSFQ